MTAADLVKALGGRGSMAKCPVHKDRTPSLPKISARHATRVVNPAAHPRGHSPRTRCAHLTSPRKEIP